MRVRATSAQPHFASHLIAISAASDEDDESAIQQDSSLQRLEKRQRVHDAARRAKDAVVGAQAALDARVSDVKASQITAPFDGVVVDLKIQSGDLVAPAAPVLVELVLPDRPLLRPGTTAKGAIVLDTHPNALTLPRSALTDHDGTWSVFVVDRDGKLESRALRVGLISGDRAEVLAGLPEGAFVVLDASSPGLASGLLVNTSAK